MSSHNVFTYNADYKQPDPEIWGGGVVGGPLDLVSGLDYSEKVSYIYRLDSIPGDSTIGNFVFSGGIELSSIKDYVGNFSTFAFSSSRKEEFVVFDHPENILNISIQGGCNESFVSESILEVSEIQTEGFISEKISYDYNIDSIEIFSIEDDGLISNILSEYEDYGLLIGELEEHDDHGSTEILLTTSALVGGFVFSNSASYKKISKDSLEISLINISSYGLEKVLYDPPINEKISTDADIQLTGTALYQVSYNSPEEIIDFTSIISSIEKIGYSYNESSVGLFETESYLTISDPVTSLTDYGLISSAQSQGNEDFGFTFNTSSSVDPFGDVNIFGSALVIPPDDIRTYNTGATYSVVYNPPENTSTLFNFGSKIESLVYDYNEDSVKFVLSESIGLLSDLITQIDNFGLITETTTEFVDYEGVDIISTIYPFGLFGINGSAETEWINKNFSAAGEYKVVYSPDNTSGTLFAFNGGLESIIYDYNEGSILIVGDTNYGSIGIGNTISDDYGLINELHSQIEDYETILGFSASEDVYPFGNINISGYSDEIVENQITENTILVNISGILDEKLTYTPPINLKSEYNLSSDQTTFDNNIVPTFDIDQSGSISDIMISGSSETVPVCYNEVGSGSLFGIGNISESITYDYNLDSILILETDDLGSVDSTPISEIIDYGLINEIYIGEEEYGEVSVEQTLLVFGGLSIIGSAETEWINKNFSAAGEYKVVYSPDNTSGTLFGFGEKLESVTYDYNEGSSIIVILDDIGSIIDPITSVIDYGLINEIYIGEEDGGSIEVSSTSPFGTVSIIGSAETEWINKNFSAAGEYKVVYSPDNTSGTLFGFGEKLESVTYDYNEGSILIVGDTNYGSIGVGHSISDNYGFVNEIHDQIIDNGSLLGFSASEDLYPFGQLTIFGSSIQKNTESYVSSDFNLLVSGGYSDFKFISQGSETTPIFTIFGSADPTTFTSSEVGIGTLFGFGEKLESVTYDYSLDSILVFETEDFGSGDFTIVSEVVDYGLIIDPVDEEIDYGTESGIIVGFGASETISPFGSFSISGSSDDIVKTYNEENTVLFEFIGELNPPNIDYTPSIVGFGILYIDGSAQTSIVASDTGISVPTPITISEIGLERRTHSYNESSVLSDIVPDFGSISSTLSEASDDYGFILLSGGETQDYGSVTSGIQTALPYGQLTISGTTLVYPDIVYTPSPDGFGTINVTGSATYSETDAFGVGRRRGGTINLGGDALYSETDVYVGIGTVFLDQQAEAVSAVLARTRSYVGIETIILSDGGLESTTIFIPTSGIGTGFIGGTINIFGDALESFGSNPPENTQLFEFSGELTHPQIDYTPHYGIEKNIGIGTTGIQISGVVDDSAQRTARGQGSIFVVNGFSPQESYPWLPEPGVGRSWSFTRSTYVGSGNISLFNEFTRYYSPVYPRNALITDPGSGTGLIRINDDNELTFYRATLPIFARGTIYVLGIGTTANGELDGVEIGANESFTPTTIFGSGIISISGISSNREIAVYQDIVTGGLISISQQTQPIIERKSNSHVGVGIVTVFGSVLTERIANNYVGVGSLFGLEGSSESYSAQTPEDTILINVSGFADESITHQGVENTVTYELSGNDVESITYDYEGSGQTTFGSSAIPIFRPRVFGTGGFKFTRRISDDTFVTCDSTEVTSDYTDSANVSFVANPIETEVLFNISGNSDNSKATSLVYVGDGNINLGKRKVCAPTETFNSESATFDSDVETFDVECSFVYSEAVERFSSSYINTQLFGISGVSEDCLSKVLVGFGSFTLSSFAEFNFLSQTPENTILVNISGFGESRIESEYPYVGINLGSFFGSAETLTFKSYRQDGSGIITLSGNVVYPDIIFIPSPDGRGTIQLSGSSGENITNVSINFGTLFALSSGLESISKSTYTGIGTVYIQELSGSTINNPFQIPRTYVCII